MKKIKVLVLDIALLILAFSMKQMAVLMSQNLPRCVFLEMGFLCPACGGTRCIYSIASGEYLLAFYYNQFIFITIIYLVLVLVLLNINYLFNIRFFRKTLSVMVHYKTIIVIVSLYAVFGILRNFI